LAQIQKIKIPRHMYSIQVANSIRSGSGIQDILSVLNKDGVEELFDDFHGDSVGHKFFEVTGTGTATYAVSKAVLTTTAADRKTTGLMSNTGWTAGQDCMVQARFMVNRVDNKVFFGFANAEGGADEGVIAAGGYLTPSWLTATSVIGFGFADVTDDTAALLPAWSALSACSDLVLTGTPAATRVSLGGYGAAHGSNHATATTYTVNGTPFSTNQLKDQILHVPGFMPTYVAGADTRQRHMMIHSNTTSVITGHWMGDGSIPEDDVSYSWGNGPQTSATLGLAIPVASEYHTFTVKLTPALEAHFLIDGREMCVLPNAVTATTTSLLPIIECTSSSATASIMYVDYILAEQSRRA